MPTPDQLISEILRTINDADEALAGQLPLAEKRAFAELMQAVGELERNSRGEIKPTVKNIKLITKISERLNDAILNPSFNKGRDQYIKAFETVNELQKEYFAATELELGTAGLSRELQKQTINQVSEYLGRQGIGSTVTKQTQDILRSAVLNGGKYEDLVESLRVFMLQDKAGQGAMQRYARTYITDSLNQYAASYNAIVVADLGLQWYKYVGGEIETTREICRMLIDAKKTCMPFIHRSQFDDIIRGEVCGEQAEIYDKTGLPQGMIEGTNVGNFQTRRGGYNCRHQLIPVSSSIVPQYLRDLYGG
jgi:hypothetical protein